MAVNGGGSGSCSAVSKAKSRTVPNEASARSIGELTPRSFRTTATPRPGPPTGWNSMPRRPGRQERISPWRLSNDSLSVCARWYKAVARLPASSLRGAATRRDGRRTSFMFGSKTLIDERNSARERMPSPPCSSASRGKVDRPVVCSFASGRKSCRLSSESSTTCMPLTVMRLPRPLIRLKTKDSSRVSFPERPSLNSSEYSSRAPALEYSVSSPLILIATLLS